MKIKLRPQWTLLDLGHKYVLLSESYTLDIEDKYVPITKRLISGVETAELSDAEFDDVEALNERGALTFVEHDDAPFWELSGADFFSVSSQLKHVTIKVVDLTLNGVGEDVRQLLLASSLKESDAPRLTVVIANSYEDIKENKGAMLPIICNRMKLQFGPIVFPWGASVCDITSKNPLYLSRPNYQLPVIFDKLQRPWIAMMVLRLIALNRFGCYKHAIEYNLSTQELKTWPVEI